MNLVRRDGSAGLERASISIAQRTSFAPERELAERDLRQQRGPERLLEHREALHPAVDRIEEQCARASEECAANNRKNKVDRNVWLHGLGRHASRIDDRQVR